MLPTAMVGMQTSLRILSAKGTWNMRPYTGFSALLTCPEEQSITSAPASLKYRATSAASSGVRPPGTQSLAEMRTLMGRSFGQMARIALKTSTGKRHRFSSDPPYSSNLRLVRGEIKLDIRYPCAQWNSSQSNPASAARRVAFTKSMVMRHISAPVASRGICESPSIYGKGEAETSDQFPDSRG